MEEIKKNLWNKKRNAQGGRHRTRQWRVREYREVIRMCIAAQIILVAGAVIVAFFGVIGFGPNFKK